MLALALLLVLAPETKLRLLLQLYLLPVQWPHRQQRRHEVPARA